MSPLPLRKLVKAICAPSGDQAGASLPTTSTSVRADAAPAPSRSAAAPIAIGRIRRMALSVSRIGRRVSPGRLLRLDGMFGAIVAIMLAGFITGALARLAVPGPD